MRPPGILVVAQVCTWHAAARQMLVCCHVTMYDNTTANLHAYADAAPPTSTPGSPPPRLDTALATAAAAALSAVCSGTLKLTTQGTAPSVTTPAAGGALLGPASGG
jgi:hypothetical protein